MVSDMPSSLAVRLVGVATLMGALASPLLAHAGVAYSLDRPSASPGESVRVTATFFNDTATGAIFDVPSQIVLQWRGADGQIVRSIAKSASGPGKLNVPVNNFANTFWEAIVPASARGLQAVSIEGEKVLLALDATGRDAGTPATAVATVPVTDPRTGVRVPDAQVARLGVAPEYGPSPEEAARNAQRVASPAFERFRSSISEYEPVYFSVGTRGITTARFQLSAKYRLFNPTPGEQAGFAENLYLAYTQRSLWDLEGDSKPFIDTTFNPSAFWLNENLWTSESQNWRVGSQVGVEHRSNGKDGEDSRSVNNTFLQPSLSYRFDGGSTLSFAPRIRQYFQVARENSDYADYAGHVDWNLRFTHATGVVASVMYQQGDQKRRTTQLDLAWPLKRTWLDMNGYVHLQYFNGYGETLLGYNERNRSQFRIGLSLVP